MGSRAREVLLLLVERAGEIVHKRELIAPLHCATALRPAC
jgi:DNA-binding winged helix-turn-helix (wHTH) protein